MDVFIFSRYALHDPTETLERSIEASQLIRSKMQGEGTFTGVKSKYSLATLARLNDKASPFFIRNWQQRTRRSLHAPTDAYTGIINNNRPFLCPATNIAHVRATYLHEGFRINKTIPPYLPEDLHHKPDEFGTVQSVPASFRNSAHRHIAVLPQCKPDFCFRRGTDLSKVTRKALEYAPTGNETLPKTPYPRHEA